MHIQGKCSVGLKRDPTPWQMKLRQRSAFMEFTATDPNTGRSWTVMTMMSSNRKTRI